VGTYRIFDKCSNPFGDVRRGASVGEAVIEGAGKGQCRSHDGLSISGNGFIGDGTNHDKEGHVGPRGVGCESRVHAHAANGGHDAGTKRKGFYT
jgi:hypothetical protein